MKNKKLLVTAIAAAMVLSMQATTVFAGEVSDSDLSVATVTYAENSGEQETVDAAGETPAEEAEADSTSVDDETDSEAPETTDDETDGATSDETADETDGETTEETGGDASTPSVTEVNPAANITEEATGADNAEDITYDASSDDDEDDDDWENDGWEDDDWEDDDWEDDENADEDVDWEIEPIDPQMIDDIIASFKESLDEIRQSQTLTQEETEQLESVANLWIGQLEELKKTELTGQDVMDFFTSIFVELFKEATADMAKSGQCGDNLQWELNVDAGKLTVSGKGDMYDYDDPYAWLDNEDEEDDNEDESEWLDEWLSEEEDEDGNDAESSGFMVDFSKFFDFGSYADDTDDTKEPLSIAPWLPMFPLINDVTLEDGVTSIGMSAFPGCVLETLTLPSSVTRIGSKAFEECDIDDVYYAGTKEDWAQVEQGTDNGEAFNNAEMHYLGSQREEEPTEDPEEETDNQPEVVNPSDGGNTAPTETKHQSVPNAIDSPATGESAPMLPLLTLMASVFSMAAAFLSGKLRTRSGEEC